MRKHASTSSVQNRWLIYITPETKKFYEGRPVTTAFEGPTDRGTRGVLSFALDPSFVPEDLIGKKVRLRGQYKFLGCDQPGGPQISAEPAKLSITTLRDSAGELLVVAAASTPTAAGGVTSFIPELAPELGISWIADASCGQPALELKVQKTGEKIAAKERQRRDFELDGKTYVFATEAVRAPQTEQYCGFATWVVYRKGFFKPVPRVGTWNSTLSRGSRRAYASRGLHSARSSVLAARGTRAAPR